VDDVDLDGLPTGDEFARGTDPLDADSDDDRLFDGEEVALASDPLRYDTDGDQVGDGLEVVAGSDPTDFASVSLAGIVEALAVAPPAFEIVFNTVQGESSRRLEVTATLIDGAAIEARSRRYGTGYATGPRW
jgi:hypothetical protein